MSSPSFEKTGRNDACPCGSGKKFKKCCAVALASDAFDQLDRARAYARLEALVRDRLGKEDDLDLRPAAAPDARSPPRW